ETHPHATACRLHQRVDHLLVGKEVGVGDVDGALGRVHGKEIHGVHGDAAAPRRATNHLGGDLPLRLHGTREVLGASEGDARGLEPVLGEGALELLHYGPLDPDVRVTPVVGLAPVASPLPAGARSAHDAHEAVRDEDATVIAVVDLVDGEWAQRTEALHFAARVDHALAIVRGHGQGAHRVEQDVDGQALAAALRQGVGDVL